MTLFGTSDRPAVFSPSAVICRFSLNLTYFSLSLNVANFGMSVFLTQMIFGLSEVPAHILSIWLLEVLGRKVSLVATLLIGGFSVLAILAVPRGGTSSLLPDLFIWSACGFAVDLSPSLCPRSRCRCDHVGNRWTYFLKLGRIRMFSVRSGALPNIFSVSFHTRRGR